MDRRTRVGQIRTPPRASSAGRERISLTSPISPSPWRLIVFVSAAVRVSVPALRGLKTPSAAPGENAFPHLDPPRKRIMIGADCVAQQPNECVGFPDQRGTENAVG